MRAANSWQLLSWDCDCVNAFRLSDFPTCCIAVPANLSPTLTPSLIDVEGTISRRASNVSNASMEIHISNLNRLLAKFPFVLRKMATAKIAHTNNYLEIAVVAVACFSVAKLAINCNNCRLHISTKVSSHEAHIVDENANGAQDCGTQMSVSSAFIKCSSDDAMNSLQRKWYKLHGIEWANCFSLYITHNSDYNLLNL